MQWHIRPAHSLVQHGITLVDAGLVTGSEKWVAGIHDQLLAGRPGQHDWYIGHGCAQVEP